jgi:uncharacterized protein (TIGR02284 family)
MENHNKEQAVNQLNQLLTKNYDAEAGYKDAAENVEDPQLKNFFQQAAQQRYDFGHKIKSEIKQLGGAPEKGTSVKGDLHRAWIDLKSAVAGQNSVAVLNECERGETAAIEDYKEALNSSELPTSCQSIIQNQLNEIQGKVRHITELKDQYGK